MKQIGNPSVGYQRNQEKIAEFFIAMLPNIWDGAKVYSLPAVAYGIDQLSSLANAFLSFMS